MSARWLLTLLFAAPLSAQTVPPQRNLADLQAAFERQWQALAEGETMPTREQHQALLQRQADELEHFLRDEAKADDRWNGRLMLADMRAGLGDRDAALRALQGIDPKDAPGLIQLTAADLASRLGDDGLRQRLIQSALARPAPLEERMAMARVLMTLLREVAQGEAMIQQALDAATDDEAKAKVRWFRAEAIREREDLPENSYYHELESLAKDLPKTYWGGVARDRVAASQLQPGSDAIPFTAPTLGGGTFEPGKHREQVVLLVFWSAADPGSAALTTAVAGLKRAAGADLAVLGIAIDPDPAAVTKRAQELGADWPQVCDGRVWQSDLALRWHVETVPTVIVIGRGGKLAGLNLHTGTEEARAELRDAVQQALGTGERRR